MGKFFKTAGKIVPKVISNREARKLPGFSKSLKQVKKLHKLQEENLRLKAYLKNIRENYSFTRKITKKTERKN